MTRKQLEKETNLYMAWIRDMDRASGDTYKAWLTRAEIEYANRKLAYKRKEWRK